MAIYEFVTKHQELLALERETEIQESSSLLENASSKELQVKGLCLVKLYLAAQSTGLYGRTLITLEATKQQGEIKLPSHRISTGDIVGISPSQKHGGIEAMLTSGIVWRVTSRKVVVAVDEEGKRLENEGRLFMLMKLTNDVTYKRLKKALNALAQDSSRPSSHLADVLFGNAAPGLPFNIDFSEFELFNPRLDASQQEAVKFAVQRPDIAVIHGPPGTGKTTTVVEVILQSVKQGKKVLACAPSNVAVDNMVEKLAQSKAAKILRVGHPARLLRDIQRFSLDAIMAASDAGKLVQDVRRDVDKVIERMGKSKVKDERRSLQNELKFLRKELRSREEQALKFILASADVVLATTTGASRDGPIKHLPEDHFDLVVIDECAQSLEAGCWIPLHSASRCVLAGDHQQLPPTILSKKAAENGLGISLMERVIGLHGDVIVKMLTTQYRMHSDIMTWSSDQLYEGRLLAHESVSSHLLKDIPGVEENEVTILSLLLIDTVGCDLWELDLDKEISKGNEGEADLVSIHVESLISSGVKPTDIAVIAPYNLQVELIRLRLSSKYPGLEVNSVDGFQGREKEAVVISLVRSNTKGEVGFLAEDRRINVAVTRARRHLAIICNSETVGHHEFLKSLVDYMSSHGEVQSAFQYSQELELLASHSYRPNHLVFKEANKQSKSSGSSSAASKPLGASSATSKPSGASSAASKPSGSSSAASKRTSAPRPSHTQTKEETELKEENDRKDEEKFRNVLEEFQKGSEVEMRFAADLTSRERFIIHEVAEKLNLYHLSKGAGTERCIIISKQPIEKQEEIDEYSDTHLKPETDKSDGLCNGPRIETLNIHEVPRIATLNIHENQFTVLDIIDSVGIMEQQIQSNSGADCITTPSTKTEGEVFKKSSANGTNTFDNARVCQHCQKSLPIENLVLHEIHCEKIQERKRATEMNKRQKAKIDKSKQKNILEKTHEEDFDKLVKIAKKQDGVCNFLHCKQKIFILGILCEYCNRRYCMNHQVPEVHGCGEMAKVDAIKKRNKAAAQVKQRSTPSMSGKTSSLDSSKKAALQKRMEKKRIDMEQQRQKKSNKK